MTATLNLLLAGPLQSWGGPTRTQNRPTNLEPTKSGVVGLCAAALGINRGDPTDHLTSLKMGVRVDQEGHLERDYQTVSPHPHTGGNHLSTNVNKSGKQRTTSSEGARIRQATYLADACFTVALTGDNHLLHEIADALTTPTYPLSLGRAAFPPSRPPLLGITPHNNPEAALRDLPWQATPHYRHLHPEITHLRAVIETEDSAGDLITDVPTQKTLPRAWASRRVTHTQIPIKTE